MPWLSLAGVVMLGLILATRGVIATVVLAVLTALLAVLPETASAQVAAQKDEVRAGAAAVDLEVPLLCPFVKYDGLGESETRQAAVWVPPNGSVRMHTSSYVTPGPYSFSSSIGQFLLEMTLSRNNTNIGNYGTLANTGYVSPGSGAEHFDLRSVKYNNYTSTSELLGAFFWVDKGISALATLDWEWFEIEQEGPGQPICDVTVDGSDLFGPNPSKPQQCPPCTGGTSNSVDTSTGNEHRTLPGLSVGGRGPGLSFEPAYNSLSAGQEGRMGRGWRHSYDMSLSGEYEGKKTVFQEGGSTVTFTRTSGGTWVAPATFDTTLTEKPNGEWEFVRRRAEAFTFRSDGRLARVRDRNGYATDLVYTASGDLDYVEDEAGRRLTFTWGGGRVKNVVAPTADGLGVREISMDYTNGDLTKYTDVGGGEWKMTYDAQHRLTSVRSPRFGDATAHPDKVWEYHYDTEGRVDWEEDPQNRRTEIHYDDPAVNATRVVEPDGDARVDWYTNGVRTKVTHGYGTADASTTEYGFDPTTGMLTSTKDGRGKTWTTQYGYAANPYVATKTIDPLNRQRTMTYNSVGDLLTLTDAEGVTTRNEYDANGNLEKTIAAEGTADQAVTDLVYGDTAHPGDVTKMIDARGKEWLYSYAAATGDRLSATDPLGNKTTWGYNNLGWATETVSPKGNVSGATPADHRSTTTYDKYGAPLETANAAGDKTVIEYDPDGNVVKVTDPTGDVTRRTWSAAGELSTEDTGDGTPAERTVTYSYDADGRMASWSADPASVWQQDWDALGRLKAETDPNGKVTRYAYDGAGNLTALTQPGGTCVAPKSKCITYSRDDAGQITGIDYADAAMGDVTLTYDDNGHRLTQTVAGTGPGRGTSIWEWTALGQLASQTDAAGQEIGYEWDATGNLKELTYPGQTTPVVYGYDSAGRMNAVTDWRGNHTEFAYDANSNLTQATYPTDTGLADKWSYDNLDRLDTLTWDRTGGGATLGSIDYSQNKDGRVTGATATGVPGSPAGFTYDSRNQLKTATGSGAGAGSYSYDDRGYLTRTPDGFKTYDPAGQLDDSRRAITVVGTDKAVNALSNTLNLDVPTTIAADDQIFIVATLQANHSITTPPAGYTVEAQDSLASGARIVVFRKTAVGDETTASVKFSGGSKSVMLIAYRGLDATDPVAASTTATANDTTSLAVPGLTAPGPGTQLVLVTGGTGSLLGVKTTPPASMTTQVTVDNQGGVASSISDETLDTGGATGAKTATFSQTNDAVGVLLALNPETRTYGYDDLGHRTSVTTPTGNTAYSYDQVGQLTAINGSTGTPLDDLDGYAYDGDGLRVQAPINGQDTHFTWARAPGLPLLLQETAVDANGDLDPSRVSSYIYGPGGQVLTRLDPRPDIELVGTESVAAAGAATITLPLPNGLRADDQILIGVTHASGITPTIPTGYTEVDTRVNGGTTLRLWRRTATGDEGASVPITFTSSLNAAKAAVAMVYRGVDPIDPIVDLDGAIVQGTSISIPSLDPASAANHTAAFGGSIPGILGNPTWTPPVGYTELEEATASGVRLTGIDRDTDTAAATGPITLEFTTSSKLAAVGLVLRQAPALERWHHADHLGSTRILTDERGRVVGKASYTPYGQIAETTGETSRLGYAGQYTDPDTDLVYLRARYYDPATSQFLTRDPLLAATQDPYGYAANDPVNLTDPTGMCPWCLVIGGALSGAASDLAYQAVMNIAQGCAPLSNIKWGQVAGAALVGGIFGGAGAWVRTGRASGLNDLLSRRLAMMDDRGAVSWGRGGQKLSPDPAAGGFPHSTFRRGPDGTVTHYVEWSPNARSPRGYDIAKRYDGVGGSHYDKASGTRVPTPHVQGPWGVRSAEPGEIPR